MRVTILGCGASAGVPLITGDWGKCNPANPKNKRTRSSVLVQSHGLNILIDTAPDLKTQLLENQISQIDAVIYTHAHADHIMGIDELRQFYLKQGQVIPIYADTHTLALLQRTFPYAFNSSEERYPSILQGNPVEQTFTIGQAVRVEPILQFHGPKLHSFGFRINDFAYSTDFNALPGESIEKLRQLKLWVVACLRYEEHPTHPHFDGVMDLLQQLQPQCTVLTHMNQMLDYEELLQRCPPGVEPAYDGMTLDL